MSRWGWLPGNPELDYELPACGLPSASGACGTWCLKNSGPSLPGALGEPRRGAMWERDWGFLGSLPRPGPAVGKMLCGSVGRLRASLAGSGLTGHVLRE